MLLVRLEGHATRSPIGAWAPLDLGLCDGIADHGASLACLHFSQVVIGEVIAACDPGGDNSCPGKHGCNHGIVLNNPVVMIPAMPPLKTRNPSTIEPSPLRLTSVPIKEIDPFRTAIPLAPLAAPYRCRLVGGLHVARPADGENGEVTVIKPAVICRQVPLESREGEVVNEFIRARLVNRLTFLDFEPSFLSRVLRLRWSKARVLLPQERVQLEKRG